MNLLFTEKEVIDIIEIAIAVYEKNKWSAIEVAKAVIETTKEMIAKGQMKDGIIHGSEEEMEAAK